MGEPGSRAPLRQLRVRFGRISRYEFDRGVGKVFCLVFGQEYRAMICGAEKTAQRKGSIDDLALPLSPHLRVGDSPRFRAHKKRSDLIGVAENIAHDSALVRNSHTGRFQAPGVNPNATMTLITGVEP
jgi:hypothetical protein